ncbi:hypothetical protein [Streptomyces sp. NPDC101178]|uniref:hypothetical protein n=1 Tax=Streptomyces sp. NPDC101178 TaxID=3366124 RepID=UPI0037FEC07C
MAAVIPLFAAPIASAADAHPPVRGAAPPYVSGYADTDVLRVPPGGEPATVAATGLTRPTGMVLDAAGPAVPQPRRDAC